MKAIILLGPPGSGKGSVAEVLTDDGYIHISTGELLRQQIRQGTEIGKKAASLMDQGVFVPDEMVVGMIRDVLENATPDQCFLFDGFPRTRIQAEKFDELIHQMNVDLTAVILLNCPDQVIVDRLGGRRTCPTCGAVYHLTHVPPQKEGLCDQDGATLVARPDDAPETVQARLDVYAKQTEPLIGFYQEKGLIRPVNSALPIDEVRANVLLELAK